MSINTDPLVSVIIPTYNRKALILPCIESVLRMQPPRIETIVVDNGSTDGTIEEIHEHFPEVRIIRSSHNLGVAGGRNVGAQAARGDYLLFLDNDTIVDAKLLDELLNALHSDSSRGLVGPVVFYHNEPTRIWSVGTSVNLTTGRVTFHKTGEIDRGDLEQEIEVGVLPTAFLMRSSTLAEVGLFDERFFAHYEDADFCYRLHEHGMKIFCISRARVWHKIPNHRATSENRVLSASFYITRNRILFMRKHSERFPVFAIVFLPVLTFYWSTLALRRGRLDWLYNVLRGTASGLSIAIKGDIERIDMRSSANVA